MIKERDFWQGALITKAAVDTDEIIQMGALWEYWLKSPQCKYNDQDNNRSRHYARMLIMSNILTS